MKSYSMVYGIKNQNFYDNREYYYDRLVKINLSERDSSLGSYFKEVSLYFIDIIDQQKKLNSEYFRGDFAILKNDNNKLYQRFIGERYNESYVNPVYACKKLGDDLGKPLSSLYNIFTASAKCIYKKKLFLLDNYLKMFFNIYDNKDEDDFSKMVLKEIKDYGNNTVLENVSITIDETYNGLNNFYKKIIMASDLSNYKYLFKFGHYITDTEINMAKFMISYPDEKIKKMAEYMVKCYIDGFDRDGKSIENRKYVRIISLLGQERLAKELIIALKSRGLEGYVSDFEGTKVNEQMDYDHNFDNRIYLDEGYLSNYICSFKNVAEEYKSSLLNYSGIIVVEKFGETPFSPKTNDKKYVFDEVHNDIFKTLKMGIREEIERFVPEKESSFSIIAFPTPEIGENFEKIFEDIVKLNTLDNKNYEEIQDNIIKALDQGDYVEIGGLGNNKTNLKVSLNKISNPDRETNFYNCVADVNIPLGEVFTSPVLKGTSGILNVGSIYLNGFNYKNLIIEFEDGYAKKYTCDNFDDDDKNIKYVEENLMFPHKELPMGEFAIGTNTMAYMIAKKYDIMEKLPILIIEKMGPHFAIGDTCYSWAEDMKVYNTTDGKEIIARDNELSILRKTDVKKAYTNKHIDITIPYDELDYIKVVKYNKDSIYIIKEGKFVLSGTEELNKYL